MKNNVLVLLIFSILFIIVSCSDTQENPIAYGGSQAPGDYWEYTIDHDSGTFEAVNYGTSLGVTESFTYSGTVSTIDSGFMKFTVTASNAAGVPADSVSYGVSFPENCLLVMPIVNNERGNLIAMTVLGSYTYTADTAFNWVAMPNGDIAWSTQTVCGVCEVDSVNGNAMTLTNNFYTMNGGNDANPQTYNATIDGHKILTYYNNELASITAMTPSGGFSYDQGANGGGFGIVAPTENVSLSEALSKTYRGFDSFYSGNFEGTQAVWVEPTSASTQMDAGFYTDEALSVKGDANTLNFSSAVQTGHPGLFTGITDEYNNQYVFVINQINGKYVMLGIGRTNDADPDSGDELNFFCIETD